MTSPNVLSYSKIRRYTTCPASYRYYYEDRWRPKHESATLKFGNCIHKALNGLFALGEHPAEKFIEEWSKYQDVELKYSSRDTWDSLLTLGVAMLDLFAETEMTRFENTYATEQDFRLTIGHQEFYGIIDWVGELDGIPTIVDFKTASRRYDDCQASLSEQLTAYFAGRTRFRVPIEQVAFCILVKTKTPTIQWLTAKRTDEQVTTFLNKVNYISEQILRGNFYRNPGLQCDWCDFQPLCLEDEARIAEELYQVEYEDSILSEEEE